MTIWLTSLSSVAPWSGKPNWALRRIAKVRTLKNSRCTAPMGGAPMGGAVQDRGNGQDRRNGQTPARPRGRLKTAIPGVGAPA
jgi:hypothetical protein